MAWTTRHVFAYGELLTSSNLNTNFANVDETAPAKATAKGDLFSATGANAIARVAPPTPLFWSPIYDTAQSGGVRYAPQPVVLSNGYSTYTVVNTITETDTWSYTLPANALPSKGRIDIRCWGLWKNNTGSNNTPSNKFYFGSQSLTLVGPVLTTGATELPFEFFLSIYALNATNSQKVFARSQYPAYLSALGNCTAQYISENHVSASEDTTTSKVIKFSVTHPSANANLQLVVYDPIITLYPAMT